MEAPVGFAGGWAGDAVVRARRSAARAFVFLVRERALGIAVIAFGLLVFLGLIGPFIWTKDPL